MQLGPKQWSGWASVVGSSSVEVSALRPLRFFGGLGAWTGGFGLYKGNEKSMGMSA